MHLKKRPTWFVKGDDRIPAYYTIHARELKAKGYVEEGAKAEPRKPIERLPEIVVEVGTSAYDSTEAPQESTVQEDLLEEMTKAELINWAEGKGVELKANLPKREIFTACKEIEEAE